ncbi:hypothetical protein H6783_03135 [Candidatus Nomurabacteria bacterium]|nr:hypothetical protein [Candidatus Nomurabacteria bacterium]
MITKDQIERVLRINGLEPTASDEEIRSVLVSANWHKDDTEMALMVLRENTHTHKSRVDTLHRVFNTDDRLKPETISALLGINVDMSSADIESIRQSKRQVSMPQLFSIVVASIAVSLAMLTALVMHYDLTLTAL